MTREEAIEELKTRYLTMSQRLDIEELHKANKAIDMAITALSQEEQSEWERDHEILKAYSDGQESMKPCKDAISRQAVIDFFNSVFSDEFIPFDRARMFIDGIYHAVPSVTPQPCEDAISRQAVKQEFAEWHKGGYEDCAFYKYLDKMPPVSVAEKVGRWIPVSERLPEVNQRVLVTSYGRVCYAMMTSADGNSGYPIFRLQDSLNERVICETTVHSEFTTSRITAWMPLPQPYKGESEDKE